MSFIDHLEELRWRIIKIIFSLLLGGIVTFFFIDDTLHLLLRPLENIDSSNSDYLTALQHSLQECEWNASEINDQICDLAKERGIQLRDAFKLLYWIVLGQNHGPKLASILEEMNREVLISQLDRAISSF